MTETEDEGRRRRRDFLLDLAASIDAEDRAEQAAIASWTCEAYGPEVAEVGAVCFVSGEAHRRVCDTLTTCQSRMADERQRVFRRINELAASGDQTGAYLAAEFTHPEQLLGGDEDPPAAAG